MTSEVRGGALIASSFARSPVMALSFALAGGMGIGLDYSATTPSSIKWFAPARKGRIHLWWLTFVLSASAGHLIILDFTPLPSRTVPTA